MSAHLSLAVPLLLLTSGAFAANGCADLTGLPVNPKVQWSDVWQALDNESSCTQNCHLGSSPTAELDFSSPIISIYFLVGQDSSQSAELMRVRPGDPEGSLLWQKVACTEPGVGRPMPPPMGGISVDLMGLIYDWIEQGAYGEDSEDPIPRDRMFRDSLESLRRTPPQTFVVPFQPPSEEHRVPDLQSRGFHGGPRT